MTETSCGFVALIGAPNAGKSTLINALVGSKVSVVSRKAQTTRTTVRGIVIEGAAQIIFVDTPGLFAPKRRLDRAMAASAWGAAADADVLALLIDARQELGGSAKTDRGAASSDAPGAGLPHALSEQSETIMRALSESKTRKVLVLNKIDLVDRPALLALAERLNAALKFEETFMISAATGDGLDQLRGRLGRMMAPGPWLYPEDQITDAPIRALAAEITREKLFERLHDELPYQATVETDSWKELPDGSVRIEQTIFVSRDSHKKIVIGEGGRTIKSIGTAARKEIAEANDGPVHLFLFVKVRANWLDDPERYRAMGLEFPKT
jgi:GTPase